MLTCTRVSIDERPRCCHVLVDGINGLNTPPKRPGCGSVVGGPILVHFFSLLIREGRRRAGGRSGRSTVKDIFYDPTTVRIRITAVKKRQ